ncbi:MAG: hypothetical protein OEV76_12215, partial [Anaerolineae bacterium]|nr:hypothetical protein [Anaerolineae bacterium]
MDFKDRSPILIAFGVILLLLGVAMAFLGPLEMYAMYLFSTGGRFHYEGFGFGSFMFGNIAAQIVVYYLIAVVCMPLGYGNIMRRRWARTLSLTVVGFWLVAGIPFMVAFMFVLLASKDVTLPTVLIALVTLALSYAVVPVLLIRFYKSRDVRLTFESRHPRSPRLEDVPLPVLVVCAVFGLTIAVLHVLILFNGVFPLFHTLIFEPHSLTLIALSALILVGLIWGLLRLRRWAWWGALVYWGYLTYSTIAALSRYSLADLLARMKFAPLEMEALDGIPIHGAHLAVLA